MAKALPFVLLAALQLACTSSVQTPDAGIDAGLTLTSVEVCDRIAAARCALLDRCFPAFQREPAADCRSLEQSRCLLEFESVRDYLEDGTVEINVDKVLLCEERMTNTLCSPTFPPGYRAAAAPFTDCQVTTGLLRGNVPSGQPCDHATQCAQGSVCLKLGDVCRGTCASFAAPGEACGLGCGTGSYCNDQGTKADLSDDRCEALRTALEPCSDSSQCAPELYCASGSCQPRGAEGDSCSFDPQRLSTCQPGLACDVAPFVVGEVGTCIRPRPAGQSCAFHWSCQPGLVCFDMDYTGFPASAPAPGVCMQPGPEGSNCLPTIYATYVGDQCTSGTYCSFTWQKCTLTPSLGEPCTPSSQSCAGLNVYCKPSGSGDFGTCTGPAGLGERCAFQVDATRTLTVPCASGYCDRETTSTCRAANKQLGEICQSDGECLSDRCTVQQDRTLRCAPACP